MEIFDCHGNVGWDVSNTRKNLKPIGQTYRQFLYKMSLNNIKKSIIVPFPSPGGQFNKKSPWYELENFHLLQACNFSKKLIPFPGVNPGDSRSVNIIKTFADLYEIKGIKFSHQIPMNFSIDKLIKHPLIKIIKDKKLIFMVHLGTGKEVGSQYVHTTLEYANKVARTYPDINFIFCHLGRFHKDILKSLDLPNVWMDTAGVSMSRTWHQFNAQDIYPVFKDLTPEEIISYLVEKDYSHKLIFGSDEPYTHYRSELSVINNSSISNNNKRDIFYNNLMELLNGKYS